MNEKNSFSFICISNVINLINSFTHLINSSISKFLIRPDAAVLFISKLLFMPFIKIAIRLIVILCKFVAYLVNCLWCIN